MPLPAPPPAAPAPGFGRLVYPLAITVGTAFGAILFGFSVLLTETAAGGVFSSGVLSSAFSGSVLAGALVAVPVGRWADRDGVRGVLAVGGALVAAGFAVFSVATGPIVVLAAWWLLIGPGSAMVLFDPAFVALQQWFDRTDRNRAAGSLTLLTGLAGPIFVPSTTFGVVTIGWRPTAAILGALVALVAWATAGLALRRVPPRRDHVAVGAGAGAAVATAGAGAEAEAAGATPVGPRRADFVVLSVGLLCGLAALEGVQIHRIARFEAAGFDPATLAWWAAAASLLSLPGRFLMPRLANRFASWGLLLAVLVLLAPALALTVRGTATWEMVGHFVLFGLLFGALIPLRAVVMADWFTGPRFGALMGAQAAAIAIGRAAGPGVVGLLRSASGGYGSGMAVLTGAVVASGLLVLTAARLHTRLLAPPH